MGLAIQIQNLGKKYRRGHSALVASHNLRETATHVFSNALRNFRFKKKSDRLAVHDDASFWALHDVNLEVQEGEVLGIIGRNGAGKSTLLKILSRTAYPTSGKAVYKGRLSSMLEVGAGFHRELTGRENIYLNGSIVGMKRFEIRKKIDKIIDFSGVDKFIDTPVKYYSSGMYIRLAFSVIAFLDADILVLDEVLAVGDAEFQKKCFGTMDGIAKSGRTVLLVSHNLAAIKSISHNCCVFDQGKLLIKDNTEKAIQYYSKLLESNTAQHEGRIVPRKRGVHTQICTVRLLDKQNRPTRFYTPGEDVRLEVELITDGYAGLSLELFISVLGGTRLFFLSLAHFQRMHLPTEPGRYLFSFTIAPIHFASGEYVIDAATSIPRVDFDEVVESATQFTVLFSSPASGSWDFRYDLGYGSAAMLCSKPPEIRRLTDKPISP